MHSFTMPMLRIYMFPADAEKHSLSYFNILVMYFHSALLPFQKSN